MGPCVKGTLLKGVVMEARTRLAAGDLSEADLDRILTPEDRTLFGDDDGVLISNWYPVDTYARVCELLVVGDRLPRREAFLEHGRRSAQRVVQMGLYSQVDERSEGRLDDRIGRVLVSLYRVFFNFMSWEWVPADPPARDFFSITVREAETLPEPLRLRTQGFVEYLVGRAAGGRAVTMTADYPDRSTIVYTIRYER